MFKGSTIALVCASVIWVGMGLSLFTGAPASDITKLQMALLVSACCICISIEGNKK